MATLSLRLPESIHAKVAELAGQEGISINQLINSAVAEKLAALMTQEYLARRGEKGSGARFDAVLRRVPSREASAGDELPRNYRRAPAKKKA